MRTFLWVFMNILKKIDFFRAFEKMLKNLTFWTSPKLESLVQSTWGFFCNGFRICFFRKKYFQTDCDLEKKWPFDSLRQPILIFIRRAILIKKKKLVKEKKKNMPNNVLFVKKSTAKHIIYHFNLFKGFN
jgi:hypothetical protein